MQLRSLIACLVVFCVVAVVPGAVFAGEDRSGSSPTQGAPGDDDPDKNPDEDSKGDDWYTTCAYALDDDDSMPLPGDPIPEDFMDNYATCRMPTDTGNYDITPVSSYPQLNAWRILNDDLSELTSLCKSERSAVLRYNYLTLAQENLIAKVRKFYFDGLDAPVGGQFTVTVNETTSAVINTYSTDTETDLTNRLRFALSSAGMILTETDHYFVISAVYSSKSLFPVNSISVWSEDSGLTISVFGLEDDDYADTDAICSGQGV